MDEVRIKLPADVLQGMARGEHLAVNLDEIGVRLVLACTPEAVETFRDLINLAMLNHLRPADGVH